MPPGPPPGTLQGADPLDQAPPAPGLAQGVNPGMPIDGLAQGVPPIPSQGLPKQVLTGIIELGGQINEQLNSIAQIVPDLAPDVEQARQAVAVLLSKVQLAGGGPASPTATGPSFPGGGLDRGGSPLASGGLAT